MSDESPTTLEGLREEHKPALQRLAMEGGLLGRLAKAILEGRDSE